MTSALSETRIGADVRAALSRVYDPCSVAAGRPTSLLDMGMVVDWSLDSGGALEIVLCVTFSGCTMAPHFMAATQEQLLKIDGVNTAAVRVDPSFEWSPDRMAAPKRPAPPPNLKPQAWRQV